MSPTEIADHGVTFFGTALRFCLVLMLLTDRRLILRQLNPTKRSNRRKPLATFEEESLSQRWIALSDVRTAEVLWAAEEWVELPVADDETEQVGAWIRVGAEGEGIQGPPWPQFDAGLTDYLRSWAELERGLMIGLRDWTLMPDGGTAAWFIHALGIPGIPGAGLELTPGGEASVAGYWRPMYERLRA